MEQNKFKYYSKKITIPNLHNKKTFWIFFFLIVLTLTFFRNLAYYETKQVADSVEITNLAKTIHLNLKKCLGYKNNKDDCIQELKDDLNNNLKPFGIVQLSDKNKILISYDRTKPRHMDRKLVTLPQYLTTLESYDYNLYIAKHSTPNIFISVFRSMTFSIYDLYTRAQQTSLKDAINWYKSDRIFQRSKGTMYFIIITFIVLFFIRTRQQQPKKEDLIYGHNPKDLVRLLSNFTIDTPIKYTTHEWRKRINEKYINNFNLFLSDVHTQIDGIKKEMQILSPNLYIKIYDFIVSTEESEKSWCSQGNITIGWSSLPGLRGWINEGNEPFDFKLNNQIDFSDASIIRFGEVIELFKDEIEIRGDMLQNIFLEQKRKLGRKFKINISDNLKGEKFYTDVEIFKDAINEIFKEIQRYAKSNNTYQVEVELHKSSLEYIELHIIHISSTSSRSGQELLDRIDDSKGDIVELKKLLQNLCDWSIKANSKEGDFEIDCFANNALPIVPSVKPKGYTHILKFYS